MSSRRTLIRSAVVVALAAGLSLAAVLPVQDAARPASAPVEESLVARMVGTWDLEISGTGIGPQAIKGTSVIRLLGTRWAIEEVTSTMMGSPFHGMSIAGYDAERGKFVGTWIDNFGTKLHLSTSTWDEATQSLVADPMEIETPSGKLMAIGRTRLVDADHFEFVQNPADGGDEVIQKVTYTRKQ